MLLISKNTKLKYNGTVDFKITEFNHNIEEWVIWDVLIVLVYFEMFNFIHFHTHHSKLILEINCADQVILNRSYLEILDSIAK